MSLSLIIGEVKSLLETVGGIGQVFDYSRYVPDEAGRKTFVKDGVLNCAFISRESTPVRDIGAGARNTRRQHSITIEMFRAVAAGAESEKALQDLAEAVCDKLDTTRKLEGKGWLSTPAQVRSFGAVMFFGAVLCWRAVVQVQAEEKLAGG